MTLIERPSLIEEITRKRLKAVAEVSDDRLVSLGCTSYVKTMYVGDDLNA